MLPLVHAVFRRLTLTPLRSRDAPAIDFLKLLLCEPEDRLGSVVAPTRPNSHLIQERRSGFAQPPPVGLPVDDGASQIKVRRRARAARLDSRR